MVVEEETEDHADDDCSGEHPSETCEVAAPQAAVVVVIGHSLRSLSGEMDMWPGRTLRASGNRAKLPQRTRATNRREGAPEGAPDRVARRAVVMAWRPICRRTGCL